MTLALEEKLPITVGDPGPGFNSNLCLFCTETVGTQEKDSHRTKGASCCGNAHDKQIVASTVENESVGDGAQHAAKCVGNVDESEYGAEGLCSEITTHKEGHQITLRAKCHAT
jgi:hypothetical protein